MRIERIKSRGDKETAAVCTRPNLSELVDGERERIERMKRREIQTWRDREREIEREGKVENGEN